jgi:hypothetical protein
MEVFVQFNYNGTPLTNGTILISGKPEQIFYVKLDEPVSKLIQQIEEAQLYSKTNGIIARDATMKEVKQVKSEDKSFFSMFGSTDNLLTSPNKPLKDVLTLEPGKRVILNVQVTSSSIAQSPSIPTQGGRRKRKNKTRKNKKV